jgi:hypothetical protein
MSKKKLSELELKLKKLGILAKSYTDAKVLANQVHMIEQGTAESGYLKTYIFAIGVSQESEVTQDNLIGKVNIPKDFLVTGVKRVTVIAGTGADEGKWMITHENGAAVTPYEAPSSINAAGIWALFTINVKSGSATDEYLAVNLSELIDVYTGGDGIDVSNNVITIDLDPAGGLQLTGSTTGAKKVAIKIDSANANGLALTSDGLKLALATQSAAGAMSAADKTKLDKALTDDDIELLSDAELGSWFGYASDSTMVTTTLPAVSDDSIVDED